jgi:aromatic ring-cleaving dioxygenase
MYQSAFPPPLLASFLPWLMLNRDGLSIWLHPGTGDAYAGHIDSGWAVRCHNSNSHLAVRPTDLRSAPAFGGKADNS